MRSILQSLGLWSSRNLNQGRKWGVEMGTKDVSKLHTHACELKITEANRSTGRSAFLHTLLQRLLHQTSPSSLLPQGRGSTSDVKRSQGKPSLAIQTKLGGAVAEALRVPSYLTAQEPSRSTVTTRTGTQAPGVSTSAKAEMPNWSEPPH